MKNKSKGYFKRPVKQKTFVTNGFTMADINLEYAPQKTRKKALGSSKRIYNQKNS